MTPQLFGLISERKRCSRCKRTLPIERFYRNRSSSQGDGRDAYCSNCKSKIQKTPAAMKASREARARHRQKYPERVIARRRVNDAIPDGRLARGPCEVCGSRKVEAHHDDYSKPLEVRWLCRRHHYDLHLAMKEQVAA